MTTDSLHNLKLWIEHAKQRIEDDAATIRILKHQVAVARLPRFNDRPAEGCPNGADCLDAGNCLRKCSAWRPVTPANNTGD